MPTHLIADTRGALALSREGMVTSPHELASQAGRAVLRAGGNARSTARKARTGSSRRSRRC